MKLSNPLIKTFFKYYANCPLTTSVDQIASLFTSSMSAFPWVNIKPILRKSDTVGN